MERTDYATPKDTLHPRTAKARADALERVEKRMLEVLLGHSSTQDLKVGDVTFFARFAKQLAADVEAARAYCARNRLVYYGPIAIQEPKT